MDLEHLNRTQIIFLTLLVSFVTSIATGIVTVSLMNQAPPQLAATVNHVIEHTIEQVEPATQAAAPATVVKTIVENDDLGPQAIATVQESIIRIVASSSPSLLVARGIIIDAKGVALSDRASLDPTLSYEAILPNGTEVPAVVHSAATTSSVVLVDLQIATSTVLVPATFADPSKLELGQTVIRIGGAGADTVSEGVIASLPESSNASTPQDLEASVSATIPGSVLISLYGEVLGISTTDSENVGDDFYSMPSIFEAAASAAEASSTAASSASSN